jgi:hypothetical protein
MDRAKYIENLRIAWVNDTATIVILVALGHRLISLLSPTLATFTASVVLGWTLVAGTVFTLVHALAHQSGYELHRSRLTEAGHLRHKAHHAAPHELRFVRRAPAMEVINIGVNILVVVMISLWAWLSSLDWQTITLGLSLAVAHWNHAQENGHLDIHDGIDTSVVRLFASKIHKLHHEEDLPVTALYAYQLAGWFLVPKGFTFGMAAMIAIPEGLLAWLWPAFDRWLDRQVGNGRAELLAAETQGQEDDPGLDSDGTQLV